MQAQTLNLLESLKCERGLSFLFIARNIGVVEYMADEVAVMQGGLVVEMGPTAEILWRPHRTDTQSLLAAAPRV